MPISAANKKGAEKKKSITDELAGSIKLDPKLVDEIIEMQIWDYDPELEELLKLWREKR